MPDLSLPSPAKINLFLHITGKRADGYHNLQTLFQFIDLCDEMEFTLQKEGIRLDFPDTDIASKDNLVVRAAEALQQKTQHPHGVTIRLRKRIPMGGGLGGGSSNAATTLIALNQLWNTGLTTEELCRLGVGLGADVPIFIHGRSAIAEGVGNIFTDAEPPESWYLVIAPPCHVPTSLLFQQKQLTRDSRPINLMAFLNGEGRNDFEPVTRSLYPDVDFAMTLLERYGKTRMTGTGACVFCELPDRVSAESCKKALDEILKEKSPGFRSFTARGLNGSPLHETLKQTSFQVSCN